VGDLENGADKVSINSSAVKLINDLAQFGCVVDGLPAD
jgi:imidazole glycerol phosphate synthase subunit HisF